MDNYDSEQKVAKRFERLGEKLESLKVFNRALAGLALCSVVATVLAVVMFPTSAAVIVLTACLFGAPVCLLAGLDGIVMMLGLIGLVAFLVAVWQTAIP